MVSPLRSAFNKYIAQTSPEPDGFEVSHGKGIYFRIEVMIHDCIKVWQFHPWASHPKLFRIT